MNSNLWRDFQAQRKFSSGLENPVFSEKKTHRMKQATPLTILLVLSLTTLLSYTLEKESNVSNTVILQTQKGDSSAWYREDSHFKPTM
jgi:hypothetical protein